MNLIVPLLLTLVSPFLLNLVIPLVHNVVFPYLLTLVVPLSQCLAGAKQMGVQAARWRVWRAAGWDIRRKKGHSDQ